MWRATVFSLFPGMFPGPLGLSLAGDALGRGLWSLDAIDIRDHGLGRHRAVDDRPAGGGAGMVLRADVVAAALDAHLAPTDPRPRLLMSPRGRPLTQAAVRALAGGEGAVIVCGRFEGVDERVIAARRLTEVSIGDYVLSGGELAALVLLDASVRLLPGVMGAAASGAEESFEADRLEYPHYTRPRSFEGRDIPEVLLSGDHGRIARWRDAESQRLTAERRPDLLSRPAVSKDPVMTDTPPFAEPFAVGAITATSIEVIHRDGHWWRFAVAETNGRRLLLHAEHRTGPEATPDPQALAIDAFDAATREARRRGMVD